jgi:prevent-host-death family protein
MAVVNVYEAKTQLSRLIERAAQGEDVIIARSGRPVARLTKLAEAPAVRFGVMRGKVTMADDFDAPLPPEVMSGFEGS